jgi:nicotinate-nucleotide pyrophosphorylase (carboxylating)
MVLVKNNHIAAHGGNVRETLRRVFGAKPLYLPVEVEVRSLEELTAALEFEVAVIMLDNMPTALIAEALARIGAKRPGLPVEISGGVTVERLAELARVGVKLVSMGALTTQARNVDISLRLEGGGV